MFLHPSLMSTISGPDERLLPVGFLRRDVPDDTALRRWFACSGKEVVVTGELKTDYPIRNTRERGQVLVITHMVEVAR